MIPHYFFAFDLGAENGRVILGKLENRQLSIRELRRFSNQIVEIEGHLHWDVYRLFDEMKNGMRIWVSEFDQTPESLAVDTWGVDFALLDSNGQIIDLPFTYRDSRTDGMMEEFHKLIPSQRIYELTGIQMMPINSLYQLYSMVREKSPLLDSTLDLLFIPDIFNYLLTGEMKSEFTFATTSQLYNPIKEDWEIELFGELQVSMGIMQEIVQPGTVIGNLREDVAKETGFEKIKVVSCASHDTASAVAAIPAEGENWAYISSGTWSLMGVEVREPILTEKALACNFTNEGGVDGTFRFLKNIMGLWLVQECKRVWDQSHLFYDYSELIEMAISVPPFNMIIDPDRPEFLNPPNMLKAISNYCLRTEQTSPQTPAEFIRCILESLALKYRMVLDQLNEIHQNPIKQIHVVGGGSQNQLLCQFTADATGLPVIAGPVEATAIGNVMVQAMALGYINSLAEIREIVRNSIEPIVYKPKDGKDWEEAYERFQEIVW